MRTFGFNLVINEDAGLHVGNYFTAGKLVGKVRKEGGSGCFVTLGLPGSGKTYMMEVRACLCTSLSRLNLCLRGRQRIKALNMKS